MLLSKRKRVEILTKIVPYRKAAENTVKNMISKNSRFETLVEKISNRIAVKTPLTYWYEETIPNFPPKNNPTKKLAKSLLEKRYQKISSSKCLSNNCQTNRLPEDTVNP